MSSDHGFAHAAAVAGHVTEQRHNRLGWPLWLVSVLLIVEAAAATFSAIVERGWPA